MMAHMVCVKHRRRVLLFGEVAIHRNNSSKGGSKRNEHCDSESFEINKELHKLPLYRYY